MRIPERLWPSLKTIIGWAVLTNLMRLRTETSFYTVSKRIQPMFSQVLTVRELIHKLLPEMQTAALLLQIRTHPKPLRSKAQKSGTITITKQANVPTVLRFVWKLTVLMMLSGLSLRKTNGSGVLKDFRNMTMAGRLSIVSVRTLFLIIPQRLTAIM